MFKSINCYICGRFGVATFFLSHLSSCSPSCKLQLPPPPLKTALFLNRGTCLAVWVLTPCTATWKLKPVSWSPVWVGLLSFASHTSEVTVSFLHAQSLANPFLMYFLCFVIASSGEENSVFITLSCPEVKMEGAWVSWHRILLPMRTILVKSLTHLEVESKPQYHMIDYNPYWGKNKQNINSLDLPLELWNS